MLVKTVVDWCQYWPLGSRAVDMYLCVLTGLHVNRIAKRLWGMNCLALVVVRLLPNGPKHLLKQETRRPPTLLCQFTGPDAGFHKGGGGGGTVMKKPHP